MSVTGGLGSAPFGFLPSGGGAGGSGGGTDQKAPATYVVGTTANAPAAAQSSWTLAAFEGSYIILMIGSIIVNQADAGDGAPYFSARPTLADTVVVNNYAYGDGDVLNYILVTPNPAP